MKPCFINPCKFQLIILLVKLFLIRIIFPLHAQSQTVININKPQPVDWIHNNGRDPIHKLNFFSWIVDGCFFYNSSGDNNNNVPNCDLVTIDDSAPTEFQSFDGFYNNVFNVELGAVDTPLLRVVQPVYEDGTHEPVKAHRINPFEASRRLMRRTPDCQNNAGKVGCGSKTGKSALLVYFGQQIVEEILDSQRPGCPPEYFNIPIPKDHEFRDTPGHSQMPFLRSRYAQSTGHAPGNPRQQLNEITPWIDGGLIYGTSKGWADVLRTFSNGSLHPHGQLASENDDGLFPARNKLRLPLANPPPPAWHSNWTRAHESANVNRYFVLGNPRGNENAFLLSFGVVLFRWHNQFATYLHHSRPQWSGERVFQEARKWAIATYQNIVMYEWLPEWLGEPLETYKGYNPSIDPQIEQFFQTAAMRFGHTLVTPGAYMRDYACAGCRQVRFTGLGEGGKEDTPVGIGAVRTCNIFWRPQEPLEMPYGDNNSSSEECTDLDMSKGIADIDRLLMGMASQLAEREDNMIVEDLRGRVFGPLEFSRRDLMAINIQRGRDHGTPDYNTAREAFGLPRIGSVAEYMSLTGTATPIDIVQTMVEIHKYGSTRIETPPPESEDLTIESATVSETTNNPEEDTKRLAAEEARAWSNIDVWTGGILETSDRPGPLFRAIIKDQFNRIRNADRFWFENTKWSPSRFTQEQIGRIKTINVYDMILSVTRMHPEDIQRNPFQVPDNAGNTLDGCNIPQHLDTWDFSTCTKRTYNASGSFLNTSSFMCYFFPQLGTTTNPVENCTSAGTYDYFSGSELSFILTFVVLGLTIIGVLILRYFITTYSRKAASGRPLPVMEPVSAYGQPHYAAREWVGRNESSRPVMLEINNQLVVEVRDVHSNQLLREIDLQKSEEFGIQLIIVTDLKHVVLKCLNGYDLVLEFSGQYARARFVDGLKHVMNTTNIHVDTTEGTLKEVLQSVTTRFKRLAQLEVFFRYLFKLHEADREEYRKLYFEAPDSAEQIFNMELTPSEFAESLGMCSTSQFVQKLFQLVDKDQNGYVSFLEFLTMLTILRVGNANDRAQFLFQMYDVRRKNYLTFQEFRCMISAMIDAANAEITEERLDALIGPILKNARLNHGDLVTLDKFLEIFARNHDVLGYAQLNVEANGLGNPHRNPRNRQSVIERARDNADRMLNANPNAEVPAVDDAVVTIQTSPAKYQILVWIQLKRLELFWATMYTLVVIAIFAERAYYYSVEREHSGLRHIAGYGVTVTRGAASVMMFTYSSLLLTMCRNLITALRETFLRHFIPFDAFVSFHKYIAYLALVATIIHVVGHGINFYHISTQTSEDLTCLFRDYFRASHVLPKFHYWMFGTLTGMSGLILTLHAAIIYSFSSRNARMNGFRSFWLTHSSYPLWYLLMLIHGSGRLVQDPLFLNFLIGPMIIFIGDKLLTMSGKSTAIPVLQAEILPSSVTKLRFARPAGFSFRSGQWIRIACVALNPSEFHPFTISSSPHEPHLTVHIRAVGPFTSNIRRIYESEKPRSYPKLYLEGPFGEGHQDWHRYDVSILIGGGIGVTPFASILRDVVSTSLSLRQCNKVYFLWVTRTQKQFEWMIDIIREVETNQMISVDVFITQFYDKYDLRTTLLYICEKSFQKVNGHSIFTGLKSKTHFGRPNFYSIFESFKEEHPKVKKFGVFSCGPLPLSKSVVEACQRINNNVGPGINNEGPGMAAGANYQHVTFEHRSENF